MDLIIEEVKIFLCVLMLVSFSKVNGQDKPGLKAIRTGTFNYEGRCGQDVEIRRTEGQQIELTNKEKSKQILGVTWTSDSTYVLTLREVVKQKPCLKIG
jgi:hypothetical protein